MLADLPENHQFLSMGTRGGGRQSIQGPPSYRVGGEGEAPATVLVLRTFEMHVDLSFSYLRFAETASFDKKELRRSCTSNKKKFVQILPV